MLPACRTFGTLQATVLHYLVAHVGWTLPSFLEVCDEAALLKDAIKLGTFEAGAVTLLSCSDQITLLLYFQNPLQSKAASTHCREPELVKITL